MIFFFEDFLPVLILFICIAVIATLILTASFFLGVQKPDPEKVSLYECGFDSFDDARIQFNVRYFLVAILFIVFDLEVVLLFPWTVSLGELHALGLWTVFDFLLELVVGFFFLCQVGALEWR